MTKVSCPKSTQTKTTGTKWALIQLKAIPATLQLREVLSPSIILELSLALSLQARLQTDVGVSRLLSLDLFGALLGAALQASAMNITWMCCARVIAGVGVGAIDCVIPVWSAEVSSHSARGAFLAIEFFMVSLDSVSLRVMKQSHMISRILAV